MGNIIEIKLTEDLITLIKLFYVRRFNDRLVGIDVEEHYPESHPIDYIGYALNKRNHVIANTQEDPFGASYDEDTEKYFHELEKYIKDNILFIEQILHQFCDKPIKPGTYTCDATVGIWSYKA